ncbi:hypothetical protein, partial [Thiolapillus sp.]
PELFKKKIYDLSGLDKPDEPDDDFSVLYSAFRRNDRLSAVTRSHRLLAGGRSPLFGCKWSNPTDSW